MKHPSSRLKIVASAATLALIPYATQAFQTTQQSAPSAGAPAATAGSPQPTPQQLAIQQASREDRQRMMDQLRITSLRPSVNARVPGEANYDEAKANPYPALPDPLTLKNGKKVTTAKTWWNQRRPEIAEDFDREVYGRIPKSVPKVKWEVTNTTNETVGDVPITTKTLVGHVDNSAYPEITVDIQLSLSTPANAKTPAPVLLVFGGGGPNAGRGAPPAVVPAQQGSAPGPSWQAQALAKGWGFASLNPASIQADNGAGLTKGIIGLVNKGQPRKPDDWGSLRAWAWGADRAMDYFETDKAVDAKRVAIFGHSRYGKAAIVAMAYNPRIAVAFVSSSGAGGANLHRRNYGEPVENVASANEYHWMAGNYLKYAGPLKPSDLPVDSHQLIAMCAPRPVFIGAGNLVDPAIDIGNSDAWVDARGMFMAGVAAGPVYRLLGRKDLGATAFPPIETGVLDGHLAFRQHKSGHTPNPNWPYFFTFAEREFKTVTR